MALKKFVNFNVTLCILSCFLALGLNLQAVAMPTFDVNKDYYRVLRVDSLASEEEIRKAYRKLARLYHPDRNPKQSAAQHMQEINMAYDILSSMPMRKAYDLARKQMRPQNQSLQSTEANNISSQIIQWVAKLETLNVYEMIDYAVDRLQEMAPSHDGLTEGELQNANQIITDLIQRAGFLDVYKNGRIEAVEAIITAGFLHLYRLNTPVASVSYQAKIKELIAFLASEIEQIKNTEWDRESEYLGSIQRALVLAKNIDRLGLDYFSKREKSCEQKIRGPQFEKLDPDDKGPLGQNIDTKI